MARARKAIDSLADFFGRSQRPIYAIDESRRIFYCNAALATWLETRVSDVVGRLVEYQSEPGDDEAAGEPLLTELCPPPRAFAGEACMATVATVARQGGLIHRRAQFLPMTSSAAGQDARRAHGVLALLDEENLTAQQLSRSVAESPSSDELHRAIRRFRREQHAHYVAPLVGDSEPMRRVRAQVDAAARSGANVLVVGRAGSGRSHVARAIHYQSEHGLTARLVPMDGTMANESVLRRALEALQRANDSEGRPTLLIEHLEALELSLQRDLWRLLREDSLPARIVATIDSHHLAPGDAIGPDHRLGTQGDAEEARDSERVDERLLAAISTIVIRIPSITERIADLPILAQYFLEEANRGSVKQIGSLRADAIDLLALYCWPGELMELKEVVTAAHRAAEGHEILPADLPPVIHHGRQAATYVRREPERIVLDELLVEIEREAIRRALAQTHGNKSAAAELLGMARPRLYRRLVQLGFIEAPESEPPVFIEQTGEENGPT